MKFPKQWRAACDSAKKLSSDGGTVHVVATGETYLAVHAGGEDQPPKEILATFINGYPIQIVSGRRPVGINRNL